MRVGLGWRKADGGHAESGQPEALNLRGYSAVSAIKKSVRESANAAQSGKDYSYLTKR